MNLKIDNVNFTAVPPIKRTKARYHKLEKYTGIPNFTPINFNTKQTVWGKFIKFFKSLYYANK